MNPLTKVLLETPLTMDQAIRLVRAVGAFAGATGVSPDAIIADIEAVLLRTRREADGGDDDDDR